MLTVPTERAQLLGMRETLHDRIGEARVSQVHKARQQLCSRLMPVAGRDGELFGRSEHGTYHGLLVFINLLETHVQLSLLLTSSAIC